ncbi:hypothetical protein ABG79_00425 [Caloramator mitchellensis]|uniref:DUF2442 domain-containing protein n=1 Tax=Caloramator mitchellensis TaxID=908809 RepID=A0A0R3JVR8_CALMK|nr:DUF2442 domain-containing protein [Caloramator mitchellensis]KRQ87624.1 hypothetical protein ABG79_00425 [Caloramator mitchellensis]
MNSYRLPKEVEKYYEEGTKKIINVLATDDYSLIITFDNNEKRIFNMSDKLYGVFEFLRDINNFKRVFIDESGNIAWDKNPNLDSSVNWNNRIDICNDSIYIHSKPINSED